jgi:hypothetical protein
MCIDYIASLRCFDPSDRRYATVAHAHINDGARFAHTTHASATDDQIKRMHILHSRLVASRD